jgi:hypothetical protein
MRFLIHLVAESEAGQRVQEVACLERNEPRLENIGLSFREAKQLLTAIQTRVVETQVLDERLEATFRGWYPDFRPAENGAQKAA